MEYVELGDLKANSHSPWAEHDTKLIMHQLLEGLVKMHRENIAHRDLKPQVGGNLDIMMLNLSATKNTLIRSITTEYTSHFSRSTPCQDWRFWYLQAGSQRQLNEI
jgi:serine/threonine protein kinase